MFAVFGLPLPLPCLCRSTGQSETDDKGMAAIGWGGSGPELATQAKPLPLFALGCLGWPPIDSPSASSPSRHPQPRPHSICTCPGQSTPAPLPPTPPSQPSPGPVSGIPLSLREGGEESRREQTRGADVPTVGQGSIAKGSAVECSAAQRRGGRPIAPVPLVRARVCSRCASPSSASLLDSAITRIEPY
ncbi:uncharacterized protein J3D65DRAFT_444037 [Phyllosticta citribraziliensis]|uniref:Uncharacterized protein n=1 Tax=Phyllosticta citribraziliensis TaxID=989973 RepID=A0ABR1LIZ4_9PEZI